MGIIGSLFALALAVQKITGFVIQSVFSGKIPAYGKQIVSLVIGEGFAFLIGLNVLPAVASAFGAKVALSIPAFVAYGVTGILIAGGSNLINDVFPQASSKQGTTAGAAPSRLLW